MVWNDISAVKIHSKNFFCWSVIFSDDAYGEKKSKNVFEKDNLINSVLFFVMFKMFFLLQTSSKEKTNTKSISVSVIWALVGHTHCFAIFCVSWKYDDNEISLRFVFSSVLWLLEIHNPIFLHQVVFSSSTITQLKKPDLI